MNETVDKKSSSILQILSEIGLVILRIEQQVGVNPPAAVAQDNPPEVGGTIHALRRTLLKTKDELARVAEELSLLGFADQGVSSAR